MAAVHPTLENAAPLQDSAARDRLLAELRAAQTRLRALIDAEPECVKLLDAQGRVLEMNAAGLRMVEADRADAVIGQCVWGLVVPEHAAAFRSLTERVCRGERGILEFEIIGLKGTRRWMETHAVPFLDEVSGETRLLAITRDITDRRRAEQALRESEQRFQLFMENLPANVWIRDSQCRFTYVNPRYAQCWSEAAPATLIGRSPADLFPPDVAAYFRGSDEKVRAQGVPTQYVDNQPAGRWLKVKFPVPDGHGGIAVAGIGVDITERSRLEDALAESERRFRSFMDNAPAIAWIKDASQRYTYVNEPFARYHGRAAGDILGRDDTQLFPAEVASYFRSHDEEVRNGRGAVQGVRQVRQPDGSTAHWLTVKFPFADAAGANSLAGFAVDVSARVDAEDKARRYAEDVRSLLNRLVQTQEAERRRVADELHDLIGQNLTALGIDLQALKQQLQSRGDMIAAPRLEAMAGLVETTIDAIRGVITDLRPAALEEFGLVPALRWYASVFSERTGIKVATQVTGPATRLSSDAELALFRIVQETLTNVAKHSGAASVKVAIRYGDGACGDGVHLSVEDDGRGFADAAGARSAKRGGFGLTTMRERAQAHGGQLRVEFPGRGTRVVVEIPKDADAH
jgi:PAS domain S-box-containing protein